MGLGLRRQDLGLIQHHDVRVALNHELARSLDLLRTRVQRIHHEYGHIASAAVLCALGKLSWTLVPEVARSGLLVVNSLGFIGRRYFLQILDVRAQILSHVVVHNHSSESFLRELLH